MLICFVLASRLKRRQTGELPQLQQRLKSRLGCRTEPLSRRFLTRHLHQLSYFLPGPVLETRPLWSPLNKTNTNRKARSTPRSYQDGPAKQTTHPVPRDALAPHAGSGPARRPGMIYGGSALKLADGGTIKWLFMFQRRVFTVKRGGELF